MCYLFANQDRLVLDMKMADQWARRFWALVWHLGRDRSWHDNLAKDRRLQRISHSLFSAAIRFGKLLRCVPWTSRLRIRRLQSWMRFPAPPVLHRRNSRV